MRRRPWSVREHCALLLESLRTCHRNAHETALYRAAERLHGEGRYAQATMKARLAFRSLLLRTAGREWRGLLPS